MAIIVAAGLAPKSRRRHRPGKLAPPSIAKTCLWEKVVTDLFMPPAFPENNYNLADAELCLAFLDRERAALAQELGRVVEVDGRTGFAIPEAPGLADLYAESAPPPSSRIKNLLAAAGVRSV